jgi:hypothetical protein
MTVVVVSERFFAGAQNDSEREVVRLLDDVLRQ